MSQENEIEAKKLGPTTDFLPSDGSSCSESWFLNGAEYRKRDGYIEARNNLNPDWVVVDKDASFNSLQNAGGMARELAALKPESITDDNG